MGLKNLTKMIQRMIDLRESKGIQMTLLAACPNSEAVLEGVIKAAARNGAVMLFAATLNQVDIDGGYTGWTPGEFVQQMRDFAVKHHWYAPLYPCLDHGGPWLKDSHSLEHLPLVETMQSVKDSLAACVEAGYSLLHIDPTVDRSILENSALPLDTIVERTINLISHAEIVRGDLRLPPIAYEVGSEEVCGGLVDFKRFQVFLELMRDGLERAGLIANWPCFIVAQVGTDLHTTSFDPEAARRLYDVLYPLGSLAKGHYTDWVGNPQDYPTSGMGGANVGPEFTAEEYLALTELEAREKDVIKVRPSMEPSGFIQSLQQAVIDSGRWKKWLAADEIGVDFEKLEENRRNWLLQTGARYVWTEPNVLVARGRLYANLNSLIPDPNEYVVERIARVAEKYIVQFNLVDSVKILGGEE
jgi:D-tagatose-1,6-bisphosphate aldolase subunit GatZ/KbaZ